MSNEVIFSIWLFCSTTINYFIEKTIRSLCASSEYSYINVKNFEKKMEFEILIIV
jgi:hypothetical protein